MLDSRSIIIGEKLSILLDTEYLNVLLKSTDKRPHVFVDHKASKYLEIVRTPGDVYSDNFRKILEYREEQDESKNLVDIRISNDSHEAKIPFNYRMVDIEYVGRRIYNKQSLDAKEIEGLKKVFVWATLNGNNPYSLLITDNKKLLSNRLWFEGHFPGVPIGIVTFDEAKEIIDLFFKYHREYYILGASPFNRRDWYWLSFRTKIKHFHVGGSTLTAFAKRFIYLLMSLDEIGFQYYSGVNIVTLTNTLYHFNYFVSLLTGIFDSLAIQTDHQGGLGFQNLPQRISLNPNAGRDFLRAVREKYPQLREHIQDNVHFIKLIYELREEVIHRDTLDGVIFESHRDNERWNFIWIQEKLVDSIRQCKDKRQKYDVITEHGLYHHIGSDYSLEPYHFAKSATRMLVKFADKYLELLGFGNFVEELRQNKPREDFIRDIDRFEKGQLGF